MHLEGAGVLVMMSQKTRQGTLLWLDSKRIGRVGQFVKIETIPFQVIFTV